MLEHAMLREQFQELLTRERQAAEAYEKLAAGAGDPAVKNQIAQLLKDKQRHIKLAERLLEIVE